MLTAPNLAELPWLTHGFGGRDAEYPAGILTAKQIHSARIVTPSELPAEADALVTGESGTLIGIRTADCVPILIADSRTRAVAAVHAGWRGTAARIAALAAEELIVRFGSRPEDLRAAIGPAIGPCCYEVGPEVAREFGTENRMLDLESVNAGQMEAAGVQNVWRSGVCTRCNRSSYFSYRAEKDQAGRQVSFLGAHSV